jgi:hypothetical protein
MEKIYLIIAGCSYAYKGYGFITNTVSKYPHEIINIGASSAGNKFISETVIITLKSLLDSGVSAKNIFVIINFTQIGRSVVKLPYEYHSKAENLFLDKSNDVRIYNNGSIKFSSCKSLLKFQNQIYSFLTLDNNLTNDLKTWFDYQLKINPFNKIIEEQFETYLESIVITQSFLKKHNISSVSFLMNNVFEGWDDTLKHKYRNHTELILPDLRNTKHISDITDYTKVLWECIDLDMFVFHTTETNKYGGIDEYMIDKHPNRKYLQNPELKDMIFGNHPNDEIYEYFSDDYMNDKVKHWLSTLLPKSLI